jgi:hypothetical protein
LPIFNFRIFPFFALNKENNTKMLKRILFFIAALFTAHSILIGQVTTSSSSGIVKAKGGEALAGATITATHTPTGTVYRTTSRTGGRFDINNMNPGGPYTFSVSFVGYENLTVSDVFLSLGETARQDFEMSTKNEQLSEVVVTAGGRRAGSSKMGAEVNVGRDKIANLPSVGRNINDFVKFTPQVKVNSLGGMSFVGQNVRYNSFMIDGSVNNDVFGLSDQGTNGGRAGIPPISIDAIDQIAVQISPFDVSIGNFTGGGINAITRSGTNTLTGSVYYLFRNQDMAGKTPGNTSAKRTKLADFKNQTYGFRVGGPIIKNKLFFFINVERQKDSRPQPFDQSTYVGPSNKDSIAKLVNYMKTKYNYDAGDYMNNPDDIDRTNINTRVDWNIDAKNKLTLSYRFTDAERINPSRSSSTAINFVSGAEVFPSTTHSGTVELNSRISNRTNNKFRASFTDVVDDRGVYGDPFPNIQIFDGPVASINLGSELSSGANLLKQRIINFYDAFKLNAGKHGFTFGLDIDMNKTYNLFINRNLGYWNYASLQTFLADAGPRRYRRGYSLVDAGSKSGDENNTMSAADFNSNRLGFFVSDEIKVSKDFTLTVGVRADRSDFTTALPVDKFFNDSARAIVAQSYDLRGAYAGQMFDAKWLFAPRLGFRYNVPDENLTLRGGIGIFTGRTPLVWPGGLYQNTGKTIGALDTTRAAGIILNGNPLQFRPDVNNQLTQSDFGLPSTLLTPQGDLNLIAKDYKLPSVMRMTLGLDKKLGNFWTFSIDGIYTKNINEADWVNVNFAPPTITSTGPGVRTIYSTTGQPSKFVYRSWATAPVVRNPYTNIILIQNTTGEKGYSYSLTGSIDKAMSKGWAFNLSYSYGRSQVRNEGTSSVNTSNWTNMESVNGRNFLTLGTSDYDLGHRITSYVSKQFNYAKNRLSTTISFFYNGQSGNPFSYISANSSTTIVGDGAPNNDLPYIPTKAELDPVSGTMIFLDNTVNGITYNQAQQRELFNNYIENDKYLRKRRGQFAERNGGRLPFTNVIDLKIQQDFKFKVGAKYYAFQLGYDMFNFTNFLNPTWGTQYFLNFDQFALYSFASYSGTTPQYRFSPVGRPGIISDGITPFNSSRWTSQLTFRVNF